MICQVSGTTWLIRMKINVIMQAGNNSSQGIKLKMICQFLVKRGSKEWKYVIMQAGNNSSQGIKLKMICQFLVKRGCKEWKYVIMQAGNNSSQGIKFKMICQFPANVIAKNENKNKCDHAGRE